MGVDRYTLRALVPRHDLDGFDRELELGEYLSRVLDKGGLLKTISKSISDSLGVEVDVRATISVHDKIEISHTSHFPDHDPEEEDPYDDQHTSFYFGYTKPTIEISLGTRAVGEPGKRVNVKRSGESSLSVFVYGELRSKAEREINHMAEPLFVLGEVIGKIVNELKDEFSEALGLKAPKDDPASLSYLSYLITRPEVRLDLNLRERELLGVGERVSAAIREIGTVYRNFPLPKQKRLHRYIEASSVASSLVSASRLAGIGGRANEIAVSVEGDSVRVAVTKEVEAKPEELEEKILKLLDWSREVVEKLGEGAHVNLLVNVSGEGEEDALSGIPPISEEVYLREFERLREALSRAGIHATTTVTEERVAQGGERVRSVGVRLYLGNTSNSKQGERTARSIAGLALPFLLTSVLSHIHREGANSVSGESSSSKPERPNSPGHERGPTGGGDDQPPLGSTISAVRHVVVVCDDGLLRPDVENGLRAVEEGFSSLDHGEDYLLVNNRAFVEGASSVRSSMMVNVGTKTLTDKPEAVASVILGSAKLLRSRVPLRFVHIVVGY